MEHNGDNAWAQPLWRRDSPAGGRFRGSLLVSLHGENVCDPVSEQGNHRGRFSWNAKETESNVSFRAPEELRRLLLPYLWWEQCPKKVPHPRFSFYLFLKATELNCGFHEVFIKVDVESKISKPLKRNVTLQRIVECSENAGALQLKLNWFIFIHVFFTMKWIKAWLIHRRGGVGERGWEAFRRLMSRCIKSNTAGRKPKKVFQCINYLYGVSGTSRIKPAWIFSKHF